MKNKILKIPKSPLVKSKQDSPVTFKGKLIGRIEKMRFENYQIIGTVRLTHCYDCGTHLQNCPGIGLFCPNKNCKVVDGVGRFLLMEA